MPLRTPSRPLPQREPHPPRQPFYIPRDTPGELVAEDATTAGRNIGPCARCEWAMQPGDRVARLVSTGRWVHIACLGRPA